MGRNRLRHETPACPYNLVALPSSWRLRLVLCRPDAGVCTRCAGRGANGYGILMSASGTGALVGALLVATFGHLYTPRKIALSGVWLFSITMLALAFIKSFPLALVLLFAAGFGMLLFFSTSNTVLQTIVPDEMRGRVMGVWSLVF